MAATSSGFVKGTTYESTVATAKPATRSSSQSLAHRRQSSRTDYRHPQIEGARVVGTIVDQFRTKKIIVQKFRRRKNVRRRRGHRQPYTTVRITSLFQPQ